MKIAAVLLLSFSALALAQTEASVAPSTKPETVKRLDSVTWDLNTHKLVWVVQTGTQTNGNFTPSSSARYEVAPDEASMMFADEKRGLSAEEVDSLHHLLDILSLYCAESTVWWDQSQEQGQPTQQKTTTTPQPAGKVVKVDQQKPAPKPSVNANANMIAQAH
jgi:hypothetical protein